MSEGWAKDERGGGRQRTRVAERQPVGERRAVVALVRVGREGLAQRRRCVPPVDALRHDRGACRWVHGVCGVRGCCVHGTRTARGTRAPSGGSMMRHPAHRRLEWRDHAHVCMCMHTRHVHVYVVVCATLVCAVSIGVLVGTPSSHLVSSATEG